MYSEDDIEFRVGSDYNNKTTNGILYDILDVIIHPRYYSLALDFDIAVVIINGNIKYSIFTKPIDLPKYNWHSHINEEAIVSGFGHSQVSHDKH